MGYAAYKLLTLSDNTANSCVDYVDKFTRTFKFQVTDSMGTSETITKNMVVKSGTYSTFNIITYFLYIFFFFW